MTEREDKGAAQARSEAIATTPAPGKTLRELVEANERSIANALPRSVDGARFVRIIQTQLSTNRDLMECTPASFLGAVMACAQLGLEPGPTGRAYLIPFNNHGRKEVTLIISYKGWLDLAYRSGYVASVNAQVVYERDEFAYEYGLSEKLTHRPAEGERGAPTHFYCIIRTTSGGAVFSVMTVAEVETHRDRFSKQFKSSGKGPWATDFTAMALKTVFKKVSTWLPASSDGAIAAASDERIIIRNPEDTESKVREPEPDDDDEIIDGELVESPERTPEDIADDEWRGAN